MNDISSWLHAPTDKPKLLVIYWPTACGKTALTIELAKQYNGEVINADSRQIYRGMNIGTGKVTEEEMQGVPHHLLDILDIHEMYGVGEFAPEARRIIADITARGKLPILSGGTGLFIDAVIWNFTIPEVPADWEYRDELEAFRDKEGNEALWQKLNAVDPDYAAELDPRNYRYVIRWLEIWKATGQSKKVLGQKTESPYDFLRITPYDGDREKLYGNINQRVEEMFRTGLIEEVQKLLEPYFPGTFADKSTQNHWEEINSLSISTSDNQVSWRSDSISSQVLESDTESEIIKRLPGLNSIGYREILPYLANTQSLEKTLELVQQNSRHYAKRQLTWFRRYNPEI